MFIKDGKIVTSLIDAATVLAQTFEVKSNGKIESQNWNEADETGLQIDAESGKVTANARKFTNVTVSGTLILDVKTSIPDDLSDGEMFLYQSS